NLPFLGGNFFTGFILISLPIAFWGLYKNDKIKKDIFYGLALAIFLAILSLETEKEVLVILGFILLLLFTFIFVFRPAKKFDLQKIASKTILVITVAYLLFYSIGVVKDKKIIVNRLQLISERTLRSNPDFFNKKNHWEGEIEIIKKYPFGTGLGTFDLIYPQYKKDVLSFDKNSYSYFLQAFTEVGILGFLAFLWFILILVWRGFKLLSFGSRKENFWVPVILVSIVGSVFYNLISSNFSFLPNLAVFLIFSGIILSGYNNLAKKDREVIYTIKNRMIFLILAFLLLILGVWQVYPNVNFDLGEEVEDYNFKEAKPKYEESIRFNPNPYYLAKLAEINYYLRGHDDNLNRAYKLAERSINLTPYNSLSYIVLGRLDVASGNTKRAVENFKKAIALDPLEEINGYIYLTDIYFKEGEYKEIEETLNLVLPKYSKEIIEKRIEMESLNLEVFHLKTRIAGLYNSLGLSLLYENQPVSAEESFKRAIELNPKNPNSRYYLGVALVKQGRVSEGEKEKSDVLEAFGDYKPPYEIK
ncbi:MAG: tetratricopeptide repeat protein, partial [Candidatus Aenigmarchaeota archaeon]|nr:tetratricopeptide repeat protein [Candidatus Aenigmarchaeota archaeon]